MRNMEPPAKSKMAARGPKMTVRVAKMVDGVWKGVYHRLLGWNQMKPRIRPLSRPLRPFLSPLAAILDFAGGVALQAVRHYRW